MASEPIPLAFLGAGWVIHHGYLPHLQGGPFRVVSVFDPSEDAANALRERLPNIRLARDLDDCLGSGAKAVLVASPNSYHEEHCSHSLEAGLNVLCEKPVAVSRHEADALASVARKSRGRVAGAAVCRHRDDVRHLLDRGQLIGRVRELDLIWVRHQGVPRRSWHAEDTDGHTGVLPDLGYHMLDLAEAMLGDRAETSTCVEARASSRGVSDGAEWYGPEGLFRYATLDLVDAILCMDGVVVRLHVSWVDDEEGDLTRVRVVGDRGRADLTGLFGFSDRRRVPYQRFQLFEHDNLTEEVDFPVGPDQHRYAFGRVLDEFATVCQGGRPLVGVPQVRRVATMLDAVNRGITVP